MCKIYHNTVGHGELDCGSRGLSARWLAVRAAKEHVEILELFTGTGQKVVVFRQADTFHYKYTYMCAFISFFLLKLGSNVWKAEAAGVSAGKLCGGTALAAVRRTHKARSSSGSRLTATLLVSP